jgi:hypothetical protein
MSVCSRKGPRQCEWWCPRRPRGVPLRSKAKAKAKHKPGALRAPECRQSARLDCTLPFQQERMSSRGARDTPALHRMTERALSVAVRACGLRPARPTARARALDGIGSGAEQPADRQAAKKKTARAAKMRLMHLQPHISKTASRQKMPLCGFASREISLGTPHQR